MKDFKLPPEIDEEGLLVGYSLEQEHTKIPFGFSFGREDYSPKSGYLDPYIFCGEGHLITIAPTGAGKGVSCVVPAALLHKGDLVVMDPKGENFAITATHRRNLGQDVCLLDPFGVVDDGEAEMLATNRSINLFELLPYLSDEHQSACQALAGMLMPTHEGGRVDPFWDISAQNILSGLLEHYSRSGGDLKTLLVELTQYPKERNQLPRLSEMIENAASLDAKLKSTLDRFRLLPMAISVAFDEHRALRSGQPTRTIAKPVSLEETDDLLIDSDRLPGQEFVEIPNHCFAHSIREFAGIEPDDETIRYLYEVALSLQGEPVRDSEKQQRIEEIIGNSSEISYPVAVLRLLASPHPLARSVAGMIAATPDKTWGSMLTTLQNHVDYLRSRGVIEMLSGPGTDFERVRGGDGTSIYIVFPPHRLVSHAPLLQTIFKGLINILASRKSKPKTNTLMLMDEVAQLGFMQEFVTAKTLLRGYGVQIWSFWQDLSQLQHTYPGVWPTIVNNCKVFQAFGCSTPMMASALEELFHIDRSLILDLNENEMLLSVYGDDPVVARKPRYYSDPAFAGAFANNPLLGLNYTLPEQPVEDSISIDETKVSRPVEVVIRRKLRMKPKEHG